MYLPLVVLRCACRTGPCRIMSYRAVPYHIFHTTRYIVPHRSYRTLPYHIPDITVVLSYTVPFVPYRAVPYITAHLWYTVPFVPYRAVPYVTVPLWYTVPFVPYRAVPYMTVHLWYAVPFVPYRAVPYITVPLWYTVPFVPYPAVPYITVLHRTVPQFSSTVPYRTIYDRNLPCCTAIHRAEPSRIGPYRTYLPHLIVAPYRTLSCRTLPHIPGRTAPYHAVLYRTSVPCRAAIVSHR